MAEKSGHFFLVASKSCSSGQPCSSGKTCSSGQFLTRGAVQIFQKHFLEAIIGTIFINQPSLMIDKIVTLCLYFFTSSTFGISFELAMDGLSLLMVILTLVLGAISVSASWTDIKQRTGFFEANLLDKNVVAQNYVRPDFVLIKNGRPNCCWQFSTCV